MNPPIPLPPVAAPVVRTRFELEALLENIVQLQGARDELRRAQEDEIAAVRHRYRAPLAELENFLALETGWAEAWTRAHPELLAEDRTLACAHAVIGIRAEPPRVERASRRWTWSRIAQTIAELPWGKRYLRTPAPEVDQEALTADLGKFTPEELRNAGMVVVRGDSFYLKPNVAASEWGAPDSDSTWKKAA